MSQALVELLLKLFLVLAVGLALRRVLPARAPHVVNRVVIDAAMPALLLLALARARLDLGGVSVLWGTSTAQLVVAALALFLTRRLGLTRAGQGSAAMTSTFANTGFLGFPVVLSLYGTDARAASTALIVDTISTTVFLWSFGVLLAARYGSGKPFSARGLVRALVRPITVCVALGIIWSFAGWPVPAGTSRAVDVLGVVTSGLVFFALGLSLDLPALKGRLSALAVAAGLKLLVMPAIVIAVLWLIGAERTAASVAVLQCAMPSAMVSVIVAAEEGCDASVAAGVAALTTLCCVLTLPAVAWVIAAVWG